MDRRLMVVLLLSGKHFLSKAHQSPCGLESVALTKGQTVSPGWKSQAKQQNIKQWFSLFTEYSTLSKLEKHCSSALL